jgi:hypothetical protein
MKKIFAIFALLTAFTFSAMAIDRSHYNDITFVNHVSTLQLPVVVFCYVDNELAGTTYIYNGIVTTTVHDGQHHVDFRIKTSDGVEHVLGQTDIVLDYNDYTLTMEMQP